MCFISHNICDVVFCNIYIYIPIYIYITYYSLDNPQQEKNIWLAAHCLNGLILGRCHVCCMSYNKSCKLVSCTNKIFCIGVSCWMWRLTVSLKTPPPTTNQLDCMCSCKLTFVLPKTAPSIPTHHIGWPFIRAAIIILRAWEKALVTTLLRTEDWW